MQNQLLGSTRFKPAFLAAYDHSWSLAVRELFYFVWSFIARVLSASLFPRLCIALILIPPIARAGIIHSTNDPFLPFTPLICNIDALAVGGLLAIWIRGNQRGMVTAAVSVKIKHRIENLSLAVLVSIFFIVLGYAHRTFWNPSDWLPGVNANIIFTNFLSAWFATLVFYVAKWDTWFREILGHRLLVHPGRISYGIYVFHYPVFHYIGPWLPAINLQWGTSRAAFILINLVVP